MGSEHQMDSAAAPLELYLVHQGIEFEPDTTDMTSSYEEAIIAAAAVPDPDAIAVLVFQFEVRDYSSYKMSNLCPLDLSHRQS